MGAVENIKEIADLGKKFNDIERNRRILNPRVLHGHGSRSIGDRTNVKGLESAGQHSPLVAASDVSKLAASREVGNLPYHYPLLR
jgi:hypothetical protein